MEQMIPGVVYNLAEAQHNARRSTPNLRHSIAADSYNPNLPSTPIMANASLHSPVPRRASTAPQAFSFVNYTEDDAEELMEAVAPSGGRGGGGTPQKSRQRKPSVLSSDDEFNPTPKARARHQSIPARKSSLKTVKSVGNLARPPSRLLSPISTDVAQASFAPNQTPMSAMAAATYSAPLVEPAPRTLRRYASANFSPSLSSVADVPDQLIDPQLRIGGIPDFGSNAQAPVPAWDGPSAGATVPPMCSTPLTPAPAQAFTFMRPGSPSLYVRIPQAAPHVSVTVSSESVAAPPAASPSMPPPNGFPPLPPLPTPRWAGALPSPDPSVPSPAAPTLHLDDVVKQGVTTDPYLLVTAPVRSPSPAFAWGAQSNRKVSDPLGELALNWHASLPPVAPSPINSAPPTPFLSVPGMSGYFMWVPEPGQPTGVLPIPAGVEQAAAVQDGQPPE
ncbi:hypothetical protein Q8F55_004572 [Vanrija albida]|uniref:Uncharacterized protein n=1 Tax=Vanrija albida TaxID=181172 RepID=A0ABR3Q747_9TREE